jgi:hypothetical protein
VGDFATFATQFGYLGGQSRRRNDQGLVKGKAFDDRAGCAVLLELLKGDYPVDLVAVFTVQEEIGLRGARVAAYTAQPDLAFILECTAADDLPAWLGMLRGFPAWAWPAIDMDAPSSPTAAWWLPRQHRRGRGCSPVQTARHQRTDAGAVSGPAKYASVAQSTSRLAHSLTRRHPDLSRFWSTAS